MANEQSIGEEASFSELFERACKRTAWVGRVVKGTVVSVDDNFVTIDVGLKSEGRIAISEFGHGGGQIEIKVGDLVDVYVDNYENKGGEIVLSREKALREAAWDDFEKAFKNGTSVTGSMYGRVKGGFMVDLNGASAFLPGSQVDVRPVKDVTPLMGIEQPFIILKMDKARENIVVSRRSVLEGANSEEKLQLIENLEEGQVLDGVVKNITNYGAFVDIGGVDGLLHSSDISWKRVNHPSDVLAQGDQIKVKVIKFNRDSKRISLGMKQLTEDPWGGVEEEFKVGSVVHGKITSVTDYGIFVEVKEGVEGLVYVSEISWKKNVLPSSFAHAGEEIDVVVLDVDIVKRRMGLGVKQLQANPWENIVKSFPVGYVFESIITSIADFGLFVRVNDDVDGMVHINDITWEKNRDEAFHKYKRGDTVTVKVIEVDPVKERIALGIKQLTEPASGGTVSEHRRGTVITCVVAAISDDGVEVKTANGEAGFIKKADLSKDRQDRRPDRFAVGEKVDAQVLSYDSANRLLLLSIRAAEIEGEKRTMEAYGSSDNGASLGNILGMVIGRKDKE
ncbi:MAG: 30S ribosomal protein S1 [Holosporaceae bacterium]|jgi:small subunit ribosomal protein S1|nr:30S ribosomal protein S1 [Holosporaceae bacterium]